MNSDIWQVLLLMLSQTLLSPEGEPILILKRGFLENPPVSTDVLPTWLRIIVLVYLISILLVYKGF